MSISKERERLLDSYLAARHRIKNFIAITQIYHDFVVAGRFPENTLGLEHSDYARVLRDMWVGYFVSLIDKTSGGTNILTLWKTLFPDKVDRIELWERNSKECLAIFRKYRNECSFHANKSLVRQIKTYGEYSNAKKAGTKVIQAFNEIAIEIVAEDTKIEGFAGRIESYSRELTPQWPAFTPEFLSQYIFGTDAALLAAESPARRDERA